MIKNRNIVAFSIFVMSISNSCIGFRTISLEEKNPTSYVFHSSLNNIRDQIQKEFTIDHSTNLQEMTGVQDLSIKHWSIFNCNNFVNIEKYRNIFENEGTKLDLYLYSPMSPIVSYSKVYKKFWKKLPYFAEFQLHFVPISPEETKIEVSTDSPRVLFWALKIFKSGHSFVKFRKVEPTTIEEYEILLRIGKLIGEKDMPSINLPEKK